jgi:hypothetical protein
MSPVLGIIASSTQQGRAGGPVGAYDALATVNVLTSSSLNLIEITGIPSGYTHLQLRIFARSQRAQPSDAVYIRLNGDATNNYSRHQLTGDGASASSSGYYPENVMFVASIPAASATSSIFGFSIIDILDYRNTTKLKVVRNLDGYDANGSGISEMRSHSWGSTAAVTSITIANYNAGDFFTQYSQFALYGVK